MIPKMLKEFVEKLQNPTEEGKLSWSEADDDAYYCNHRNYTLHIIYHFDSDRELSSYIFRMVKDGKNTGFSVDNTECDYEIMKNLYCAVVANANNVTEDVSDFFADLV